MRYLAKNSEEGGGGFFANSSGRNRVKIRYILGSVRAINDLLTF